MRNKLFIISVFSLSMIGCASLTPPYEQLPVVTFGKTVPTDKDYILYFPAGEPIPTDVDINGNLIAKPAKERLYVTLKKDIYAYKEMVSFDKRRWVDARDVLDFRAQIKLPGTKHPKPGFIQVQVNEKPE